MSAIVCSLITAKTPAILSKLFMLDDAGTLIKRPGGQLGKGKVNRVEVSLVDFAALLGGATPGQALTYGICEHDQAIIVPKAKLNGHRTDPPTIARDRAHFAWPQGAGVLMLDHDPFPAQSLTREELLNALYSVWPELQQAPHIWTASASSCIYTDEGAELRGIRGQRVYVPVSEAADIPRVGKALYDRVWLAGHGRFIVSASGALLDRCLIDSSVWQPERLDFCGGAQCGPGLKQLRPAPKIFNADLPFIDSATMPDLSADEEEALKKLKQAARDTLKEEVHKAREVWVESRVSEVLDRMPEDKREAAEERLTDIYRRAVESKRLLGDFILHSQEHGAVTVGEVLDNPDKYHMVRFADPLEPDYGNDSRIAVANLRRAGMPTIYSHAHGGVCFTLHRAIQTIQLNDGELHSIAAKTLEIMRLDGAIFDRCDQLVRIAQGRIYQVQVHYLAMYLSGLIRFMKWDGRSQADVVKDCPDKLPHTLLVMAGRWQLPQLEGIVTAPYINLNGRVVESEGHDKETELYLDFPHFATWRGIPAHPTRRALEDAIKTLWTPFKDFPFIDSVARGVYLAALLTAVERLVLPTAPGFVLTSPVAGSGKTILVKSLAALMGRVPTVIAKPNDETEMGKKLFASGLAGDHTLIFDNISGGLASDSLCAFLTTERFRDRVLGASKMGTVPTRMLVLVTGKNVTLYGDLNRRFLRCEIDPECERPESRRFDLEPVSWVKEHRLQMVNAALVILSAAREYVHFEPLGGLASFEEWNSMIRRAVVMVQTLGLLDVADSIQSIEENRENDPERNQLGALLEAWADAFEKNGATVKKAIETAENDRNGALYAAIEDIAADGRNINPRKLGRWIAARKKRIVDGMHFVDGDKFRRAVKWKVQV